MPKNNWQGWNKLFVGDEVTDARTYSIQENEIFAPACYETTSSQASVGKKILDGIRLRQNVEDYCIASSSGLAVVTCRDL